MATWDSYTQKATPEDNDTLMIKDTAGGANKRTPFSGVWNWIVKKLASAVISQLETTNKSIIPAINELNSNIIRPYYTGTNSHVKVIMQKNNHSFDGLIFYANGADKNLNSLHFCHLYCHESVIKQSFLEKIYGKFNLTYNIDGNIITFDVTEWSTIVFIASSSDNIYPEIIMSS